MVGPLRPIMAYNGLQWHTGGASGPPCDIVIAQLIYTLINSKKEKLNSGTAFV